MRVDQYPIGNRTVNINTDFAFGIVTGKGCDIPLTALAAALGITVPVVVASGGTGLATLTAHAVLLGEGTNNVAFATPGATGIPLVSTGPTTDPAFGTATVPGGGTGAITLTQHGVLLGEGTSAIAATAVGTTGQMLIGATGADPAFGNNPTITGGSINGAIPITTTSAITPSTTNGIVGTTLADNAGAGSIGEYVTSSVTGVSLSSAVAANVTSISLTAGDWDVWGNIIYIAAGSTIIQSQVTSINTVSATIASSPFKSNLSGVTFAAGAASSQIPPTQRINVSSTTTIYLVGFCGFSTSTLTADGYISARRRR